MQAIIQTGGKQYKVEKGSKIEIEKLEGKDGDDVTFDEVLLITDGKKTEVGKPTVSKASVKGKIVEHTKADKIVVFKMKAKKRYSVKSGHRQKLTMVEITDVKM